MNPSKSERGATSKNVHHAYIQPGVLARGRGHNFGSLGSVKISIGKRTLIGESKNHNSIAFEQNKLAHTNNLVPPGFASMEDDAPLAQDAEAKNRRSFEECKSCIHSTCVFSKGTRAKLSIFRLCKSKCWQKKSVWRD